MLPSRSGVTPAALRRHALAARTARSSYAGEAEHLLKLLERCGIAGGTVVDIAAGDGVTQSCTLPLFRSPAWRGLAVELDDDRYRRLSYAYAQFEGATTVQARITPRTIAPLLAEHDVLELFEVLNLDLDSYDRDVVLALLESFRPAIITMEINEKVPPPVHFAVTYSPDHVWQEDHFYGCSLVAAAAAVRPAGYLLESLQYNNAFFVRDDVASGRIEDRPVDVAYDEGYRNRPARRELFPWNHDVQHLLRLPADAVVRDLRHRFRSHAGGFELGVAGTSGVFPSLAGDTDGRERDMTNDRQEVATLGGGCFWCIEAVYEQLRGVQKSVSGYMGGSVENPTYREVCTGTTGHVEVVQVTFDPDAVSFREILEVFFTIHDPTTPDRQGADVGPQYRSAVFWHSEEQKATAEQVIAELEREGVWDAPIVTELRPAETFYAAEGYHQEYYRRNPNQAYCRMVIEPKVAKFRRKYLERLRA